MICRYTHLILCLLTLALSDTRLNSYSASSDALAIGPEPPMDCPLDNPSDLIQRT